METKLLEDVNVLAVTCNQWGDTGKGKFVDIFAEWADIIARGTGGDNAGHTICCKGETHVVHIVPSGIFREGKINIIGNGTVIYPKTLSKELALLKTEGISCKNLMIAWNAKLILPTHIVLDRIREYSAKTGKIGTTGRGIGPTYMDYVGRNGLMVNDLVNPDIFRKKFKAHLQEKKMFLKNYDPEVIKTIMDHEHLENGIYYDPIEIFSEEAIIEKYLAYGREFKALIKDTDNFLREALANGKKILLEGAQGTLLSIDYGSYPYVTSSDCSIPGLAKGVGLKVSDIDLSLGIIKGFYMTRVGQGPFPTELGGKKSDEWCNGGKANEEIEKAMYNQVTINMADEFAKGIGIRIAGQEYGATTRRPRRTGWLDLPLLKYSLKQATPDVILTKLDVLDECEDIKVCYEYFYEGPDYNLGNLVLKFGDILDEATPISEVLQYCKPVYCEFPGWRSSLRNCKTEANLPDEFKVILKFIIAGTGIKPRIISVGPDREDTIFLD